MSNDEVRTDSEPHDRLTQLCARMTSILEESENADVKAIVFLHDEERGGIEAFGYDDTAEAMADLFTHLQAMFQAGGQSLEIIAIPESPADLEQP